MTDRIKELEAEIKQLRSRIAILETPKCQGCGNKVTEPCGRHPDRDCFRKFHGGTREAISNI